MSSLEQRSDTVNKANLPPPSEGNRKLIALDEIKHGLFMVVLVIAIVLAMTGWVYALGWVALKLI